MEANAHSPSGGFKPPAHLLEASRARQNKIKSQDRQPERTEQVPSKKTAANDERPTRRRQSSTGDEDAAPNASSRTLSQIQQIQQARDERRARQAEERKRLEGLSLADQASLVFRENIATFRREFDAQCAQLGHLLVKGTGETSDPRIRVCVRKRPLNRRELERSNFDVVSVRTSVFPYSHVYVHEPKARLDMSKHVNHHQFVFDCVFDEAAENQRIYELTARPLVDAFLRGGRTTFFAYGQTGSGKTHTIFGRPKDPGVFVFCCQDIWNGYAQRLLHAPNAADAKRRRVGLFVTFFEIYGGRIYDLLNEKARLDLLEDASGNFIVDGLTHIRADQLADLLRVHEIGATLRTTGATEANATSSRSHAVFQMILMDLDHRDAGSSKGPHRGKFSLVDLAGSERGAETGDSIPRQARIEGAEINKSLLALKECIRLLHQSQQQPAGASDVDPAASDAHIPFRASKLTQILRDSLVGKQAKAVMMATIGPADDVVEHTLNTLRYADRVKQLKNNSGAGAAASGSRKTAGAMLHTASPPPSGDGVALDGSTAAEATDDDEHVLSPRLAPAPLAKLPSKAAASGPVPKRASVWTSDPSATVAPAPAQSKKTSVPSPKKASAWATPDTQPVAAPGPASNRKPVARPKPLSASSSKSSLASSAQSSRARLSKPSAHSDAVDRLVKAHRRVARQEEQLNSLQQKLLDAAQSSSRDSAAYIRELESLLLVKIDLVKSLMKELRSTKEALAVSG